MSEKYVPALSHPWRRFKPRATPTNRMPSCACCGTSSVTATCTGCVGCTGRKLSPTCPKVLAQRKTR